MNKQAIKELALANGFKLKEQPDGSIDLNPYVYDFALALMSQACRAGYLEGYVDALGDADEIDKEHAAYRANEYAATVRQGGE